MTPKRVVVETKQRIDLTGTYAVTVPDNAAGQPRRYTVYLIPASPARRPLVIGQELPLKLARKVGCPMPALPVLPKLAKHWPNRSVR